MCFFFVRPFYKARFWLSFADFGRRQRRNNQLLLSIFAIYSPLSLCVPALSIDDLSLFLFKLVLKWTNWACKRLYWFSGKWNGRIFFAKKWASKWRRASKMQFKVINFFVRWLAKEYFRIHSLQYKTLRTLKTIEKWEFFASAKIRDNI